MKKFSKPFFEKKRRILSDNKEWVSGRVGRRSRQPRGVGSGGARGAKFRQNQDSKNPWNQRIILVPATVWQILNVKCRQPETEVMWCCRNFHGKTREITIGKLMFWRIFDIWDHCIVATVQGGQWPHWPPIDCDGLEKVNRNRKRQSIYILLPP